MTLRLYDFDKNVETFFWQGLCSLHKKWSFPLKIPSLNKNQQETVDLVTYTDEIFNRKLSFLCSVFTTFDQHYQKETAIKFRLIWRLLITSSMKDHTTLIKHFKFLSGSFHCVRVTEYLFTFTLHKKWSFPWSIASVNVTKYVGNCGFGHIYWRTP